MKGKEAYKKEVGPGHHSSSASHCLLGIDDNQTLITEIRCRQISYVEHVVWINKRGNLLTTGKLNREITRGTRTYKYLDGNGVICAEHGPDQTAGIV